MIGVMREKWGPKVIGGVIAVIAFVFIFYGIFMPGVGNQAPSVAGEVNGETISFSEFSRALNQRMEFFKNMMGGKVSDEQMEQFHVREAVFQDLTQRKLLGQIARKEGFYPSQDQVREQILKMDVFKKDGHFDKIQYKNVLNQNQYTPTRFEQMVGDDIMEQDFRAFLGSLAFVPPEAADRELKQAKEKRKVKYVYLDNETVRKRLDPKLKPAEQNKALDDEIVKLSQQILPSLTASSSGDSKINALLKDTTVKVKTSDWLNNQADMIPGVGSIHSIHDEVFGMKKGDPAKKFGLMGGTLMAVVTDAESYDPSKVTAKERADTISRLQYQKQSELVAEFTKAWMKKASVSRNDKIVVGKQGGQAVPVTPDQ